MGETVPHRHIHAQTLETIEIPVNSRKTLKIRVDLSENMLNSGHLITILYKNIIRANF